VLAADTLVYIGTTLFGKPLDLDDAFRMLTQLQGATHQVVTGVCLIHLRGHRQRIFFETSDVTFRSLAPEEIRHYLARIDPLDKAGAYAIQEHGDLIIREITGSFSNVVGLPMERLKAELANW
jgi:septum formation protein